MAPMAQRSCGSRRASAAPGGSRVRLSGAGRTEKLARTPTTSSCRVLWRNLVRTDSLDELQVGEGDRLDGLPFVVSARSTGAIGPHAIVDRDRVARGERRAPTHGEMVLRPTDISDEIGVHPYAPPTGIRCLLDEHTSRRLSWTDARRRRVRPGGATCGA